MMCAACEAHRKSSSTGSVEADCKSCAAREIARGIVCFNARFSKPEDQSHQERMDAYRDVLKRSGISHADVKEWL